ncbi:hypothetical protein C7974DRAFT_380819 [Boeremia exigua]|uniref:uncharacterized protein n=1 Tax=Boeremia exigua TaxID=749465 RepID=UPI001E8CCC8D|nr:uncharacterized protein C7974DRAFT_380819 [Boeremia exigua]KAH6613108.1 hypothetical protein C7974DRAFT_380819 [Boeremia exigua]
MNNASGRITCTISTTQALTDEDLGKTTGEDQAIIRASLTTSAEEMFADEGAIVAFMCAIEEFAITNSELASSASSIRSTNTALSVSSAISLSSSSCVSSMSSASSVTLTEDLPSPAAMHPITRRFIESQVLYDLGYPFTVPEGYYSIADPQVYVSAPPLLIPSTSTAVHIDVDSMPATMAAASKTKKRGLVSSFSTPRLAKFVQMFKKFDKDTARTRGLKSSPRPQSCHLF